MSILDVYGYNIRDKLYLQDKRKSSFEEVDTDMQKIRVFQSSKTIEKQINRELEEGWNVKDVIIASDHHGGGGDTSIMRDPVFRYVFVLQKD